MSEVKYRIETTESGIVLHLVIKPNSRLSEANALNVIRNAIAKLQDME